MRSKSTLDWGLTSTLEQVDGLEESRQTGTLNLLRGPDFEKGRASLPVHSSKRREWPTRTIFGIPSGAGREFLFAKPICCRLENSSSVPRFSKNECQKRPRRWVVGIELGRAGVQVEGYHPRPFGMRGGCTIPPWPRFPRPPDNPGRPNFSRSGLEPWPILREPSQTPRGLSADSHTPQPNFHPRLAIKL